ncbi:unnamed protein product [Kuraishia capsulata CBS 1993]|uniref:MATE efflux family protein n=1 Tax=Kuraishia capsulata CBS 1993 TaxID=1382522 RepID=W6MPG1_9ASCO|nr:uncharacterized protein KUCA_T00004195001 [Kuraishia capsulata CBS 1993]CDK28213.1 unnamed protein product [Kuraishia capsulata CBS 1993]
MTLSPQVSPRSRVPYRSPELSPKSVPHHGYNHIGNFQLSLGESSTIDASVTETTNLLPNSIYQKELSASSSMAEIWFLVKNSAPVLITFTFQYSVQTLVPIYYASQLGPKYLSACSLSLTTFYLTGPVFFNGFTTAMDFYCSMAYGAGRFEKVGLYCQRCFTIMLCMMLAVIPFWMNPSAFFRFISDDEDLVALCERCLKFMPIVAPAGIVFECGKRFLQSQTKFDAPTRIILGALPLSIGLNIYLLPKLGIDGPFVSFLLTYWAMALAIVGYITFIDGYQCWKSDVTFEELFSDWYPLLKLGIPGILMILSEAMAFQVLTYFATALGSDQLAAQSVISTLASFAFQLPFSVSTCASTRMANIIGSRNLGYITVVRAAVTIASALSIFNFAWIILLRYQLGQLFAPEDPQLVELIARSCMVLALNQLLDCTNVIMAGILRGQGRQRLGSILSLCSYYIIATPFELLLGFKLHLGVLGLWLGLAVGVGFLSLSELYSVIKSPWDKIMDSSRELDA